MKKKKTLIIYYLIVIFLSLLSIYSYNQKGNDFFTALSSIASDFTMIFSVITITYALFFCFDYIKNRVNKNDKKLYLKEIISILILLLSMTIVFVAFITIFSHKNIIEFINNVINKNENMDIIKLYVESLLVYYLLFLFGVNGIIISNKKNDEEHTYMIPIVVIITLFVLSFILKNMGIRLIYSIIMMDVVLFITTVLLWRSYYGKNKEKK